MAGLFIDIKQALEQGPDMPRTPVVQKFVGSGANMKCSFGMAPSSLVVLPSRTVQIGGVPMGNIMDKVPITNIPPFGMCQSMANPQVAAATAANLGTLTPMPCLPVIPAPWAPPKTDLLIENQPVLLNTCKLNCAYGGIIEFVS